ncbi:SDR family NAD(P)-dependent oxidoreductase [Polaromonas sp.]|uniref:SDR family NAD(P)-dependent oxidoreductase n=1 Tax=Polaromonas sp. TaxID=1869339 RepID=UPI00326367D9
MLPRCAVKAMVASVLGGVEMVDRVALVTGGTSGIGVASAEVLLAAGYRVAVPFGANQAAAHSFPGRTGIPFFS